MRRAWLLLIAMALPAAAEEPAATVQVDVRGPDGSPVAGAEVSALPWSPPLRWYQWPEFEPPGPRDAIASSKTDARGHAALEGIHGRRVHVVVRALGMALVDIDAEASKPVRADLKPGHSLAGVVRNDDGRPLGGFLVCVSPPQTNAGPPPASLVRCVPTGDDGAYRVDGLSRGVYEVRAWSEASRGATIDAVRVPEVSRFDPEVTPGGTVFGRVLDAQTKAPVAGATVTLFNNNWMSMAEPVGHATSREDGTYVVRTWRRFTQLGAAVVTRPGSARLEVDLCKERRTNRLDDVEPVQRDFLLGPEARIAGRVLGPDGPLAGVRVAVSFPELDSFAQLQAVETTSAEDGSYSVGELPAGAAGVCVVGYDDWHRAKGFAHAPRSRLDEFPAEMRPTLAIGKTHQLDIRLSGRPRRSAESEMPSFESRPEFVLRGIVRARTGASPEGARVRVGSEWVGNGGSLASWSADADGVVAADGTFAIPIDEIGGFSDRAPTGAMLVCVELDGHAPAFSKPFNRNDRAARAHAEVHVDPGASLRGRVVWAETGKPADGVAVLVAPAVAHRPTYEWPPTWPPLPDRDTSGLPHGWVAALSGDDGTWAIDHLFPGPYDVRVHAPGVGWEHREVVTTASDPIEFRVERVAAIEGVVVGPDGSAVVGARIDVGPETKDQSKSRPHATTGPGGAFRVPFLPRRPTSLRVTPPHGSTLADREGISATPGEAPIRIELSPNR